MALKHTLAALTMGLACVSTSAFGLDEILVKQAKDQLAVTKDRAQSGLATRGDIAQMELFVIEMEYKAGLIGRDAFCKDAPDLWTTFLTGMKQEIQVGARSEMDIIDAFIKGGEIRVECKKTE